MSKKITGSYYTPSYLADFIVDRIVNNLKLENKLQILEPSVGDGAFLNALKANSFFNTRPVEITAIDINPKELLKAKKTLNNLTAEFIQKDFLDFATKKRFSAIIGNPPYIKKNHLTEIQLKKCKEVHAFENLEEKSIKNIWTSFVIKCSSLLRNDGTLAFVLPAELLQVKFTEEIRRFLQKNFQRLEIFTFNELMFECKGQDTIVLIAYKKAKEKGVFYSNINNESQLKNKQFSVQKNVYLTNSEVKWTHHCLTSDEIVFLEKIKNQLNSINHYCDSKPGIVTAANNYFIVDRLTEDFYKLNKFTSPIIQKGVYVNGSVVFDEKDYQKLVDSNQPTKILIFKDEDKDSFSDEINAYLKIGEERGLPKRYKCVLRNNWFVIPNVSTKPEGFFFKRCHLHPKILKNTANVFVTDSAYKISMRDGFDINSLIYSFYNSLTLTFAELQGRYYGGGVLELTPSEFKGLPLPYRKISDLSFEKFREEFERKSSIYNVLVKSDRRILSKVLKLTNEEIIKIQNIRTKLVNKRLRKSLS